MDISEEYMASSSESKSKPGINKVERDNVQSSAMLLYNTEDKTVHNNDRPDLSSERAPHMDWTVTFNQNKYLVMSPRRGSTP
jgi:hypothetical protein